MVPKGWFGGAAQHLPQGCLMRRLAVAGCVTVAVLSTELVANEPVTITVHYGGKQVFYGLGAGTTNRTTYQELPAAVRDTLAAMVWRDLDFKTLRVMSSLGEYAVEYFVGRYGAYIADVKKYQPNLTILLTPDMMNSTRLKPPRTDAELQQYAAEYAEQVKRLKAEHGIQIGAVGVCNEPNEKVNESGDEWIQRMDAGQVARAVKYFRAALDARGLGDVKVIAPETSNVDHVAREMVDSIAADPQSLAALHAFATHSYNYCMTKEMRDKVAVYGKQYWQTEASSGDPEDFNNAPEAVKGVARFLSDVNLGVNVWLWFLAYAEFKPTSNTPRLIGFDPQSAIYQTFLKYFYFLQISQAFRAGTIFRFATSSLSYADDVKYGLDRYMYMENRVFDKPPLCAAAGVNPDSTWAIGIANQTGIVSHWDKATYAPAATYDVTVHVEELKDSASVPFQVYRSNDSATNQLAASVTLANGSATVAVAPHELVTLRTSHRYAGRALDVREDIRRPRGAGAFMRVAYPPPGLGRVMTVAFGVTSNAGAVRLHLGAYDLKGREVATLVDGVMRPGEHAIAWDGNGRQGRLGAGVYLLRLTGGSAPQSAAAVIGR